MDRITELRNLITKALEEIASLEAAAAGKDVAAEVKETATAEITKKSAEIDTWTKELETAMAENTRKKALQDLLEKSKAASKTDTTNKALVPAEATDHVEKERKHSEFFRKYILTGKNSLSGEAMNLITPNQEVWNGKNSREGVVVPKSMARMIIGKTYNLSIQDMHRMLTATKSLPMASTSDTQGGYTIPEDFRELLQTPQPAPDVLDQIRLVMSKTGEVTWPKLAQSDSNEFGAVAGAWLATEGTTKNATEAAFEQIKIATKEYCAYTQLTDRLLSRSAVDMEALLADLFRGQIRYELNRVILRGDGVNQPAGVVDYAGVHKTKRATAANFKFADAVNLEGDLEPWHLENCVYVVNNKAMTNYKLQADTQNRPIVMDTIVGGSQARQINGYPYIISAQLPTLGTRGDVIFGNFRDGYLGVMEQDVVVRRSNDLGMLTNTTYFTAFVLFGGRPLDGRLFSELGNTSGS